MKVEGKERTGRYFDGPFQQERIWWYEIPRELTVGDLRKLLEGTPDSARITLYGPAEEDIEPASIERVRFDAGTWDEEETIFIRSRVEP